MGEAEREHRVVWYARKDYPTILALMADRHRLAPTYDEWLMAAEQVVREVERAGLVVRRVTVRPEAFRAWCAARALPLDSKSRQIFVDEE
jgi:hypothetical protein